MQPNHPEEIEREKTPHDEADELLRTLLPIREDMLDSERRLDALFAALPDAMRASARNLVHYIVLRRHDVRAVQDKLARLGLSSLGRSEAYVLSNLTAVIHLLHHVARRDWTVEETSAVGMTQGRRLLNRHTRALLGAEREGRDVRIMVTMPREAADQPDLVRTLLANGMDVMRINCAHDSAAEWERMIAHLQRAVKETGLACKVMMDLAGPKARTGPIAPGARVARVRPQRNSLGRVVQPARIFLTPADSPETPPTPADSVFPVPAEELKALPRSGTLRFVDARDKKRAARLAARAGRSRWLELEKTAYITPGMRLELDETAETPVAVQIADVPPLSQTLFLRRGDTLILTREQAPGRDARRNDAGQVLEPARIACALPEVFDDVKAEQQIWFDDGKLGGVIRACDASEMRIEITQARPGGNRLGADKGINLPDTRLRLPPLIEKDLADLGFVVQHADLVGYSFVRTAEDVHALRVKLAERSGAHLGIVLKIETRQSFDHLPELLLAAMHNRAAGVMIARGDLAVECGFERMAEVQEEILWLCEAAHLPVIWATQVLESLTRDGVPSRAEITDAAMSERAECVMLNKGLYVAEAVHTLDDILRRMQAHQSKKRSMMRRLKLAAGFLDGAPHRR